MKAVLALLLGVVYSAQWDQEFTTAEFNAESPKELFEEWSTDFGRDYASLEEEAYRYG
eukprot:CAMPEP_0201574146 /NCGR_PEP_ID=MMETSP0190_2-20130828/18442_1 /ASSEMBLY_ACC=CAM_ASM_000263 /TAXON_ID=37353 /ORGANISM="Rosalina sp." /LENGTH=57 /DNA_ID=CAMNT_0048001983 /DNA_START=83 /DNA_END=252 /DNA_ORIENTATION=-